MSDDSIEHPILTDYHGIPVVIDRPIGFVQTKTNPDGSVAWTRTYTTDYGYIPGTAGGDGEDLDVFVGPDATSDRAYWFTVIDADGAFDEYKVVLGAPTEGEALRIVLYHIPARFVAPGVTGMWVEQIKSLFGTVGVSASRRVTASIRLTASAGPLIAPDRFRIWKAGPNPGDYGDLSYSHRADASVMGEYALRGNLLLIDIEHATNPQRNPSLDPAHPPPTAGYLALESVMVEAVPPVIGPDGEVLDPGSPGGPELWAVPRWSDCGRPAPVPGEVCCGKHQIESGQRCYVSPDWDIDVDTREPIRLNKVALVGEPATWGINLLASRDGAGSASVQSTTHTAGASRQMDQKDTIRDGYAAMKAMAGSEDPKMAKMASEMCAAYEQHAGALGLSLDGDGDADTIKPEAGAEPTGNEVDPGQAAEEPKVSETASGADPAKVDDTGKGSGPGPAVASKTAAKAAAPAARPAAPAQASKPPSASEVAALVKADLARDAEIGRLRNVVAGRLQKEMAGTVATMNLDQLRRAARDLPAPPAAPASDGGANVTAGKGGKAEEKLTAVEEVKVAGWHRKLGCKAETLTAARKAFDADPTGGETVVPDVFAHMDKVRDQARAARAALHG